MITQLILLFSNIGESAASPNFWPITNCYLSNNNNKYMIQIRVNGQNALWLRFDNNVTLDQQQITLSQNQSAEYVAQITQEESNDSVFFTLQFLQNSGDHQYYQFANWHAISIQILQNNIVFELYSNDIFTSISIPKIQKIHVQSVLKVYLQHPNYLLYLCEQEAAFLANIEDLYALLNHQKDFNHVFPILNDKINFQTQSMLQLNQSLFQFWVQNIFLDSQISNNIFEIRAKLQPMEIQLPVQEVGIVQIECYQKDVILSVSDSQVRNSTSQKLTLTEIDFDNWILIELEFQYQQTSHDVIFTVTTKTNYFEFRFQTHLLYYPIYKLVTNTKNWRIDNIAYLSNSNQKQFLEYDYFEDMNKLRFRFNNQSQNLKSMFKYPYQRCPIHKIEYLTDCLSYKQLVKHLNLNINLESQEIVQKIDLRIAKYIIYQNQYLNLDQYIQMVGYYLPWFISLDSIGLDIHLIDQPDMLMSQAFTYEVMQINQLINLKFDYLSVHQPKNIDIQGKLREVSLTNIDSQVDYAYLIADVVRLINCTTNLIISNKEFTTFFIQARHLYLQNIYLTGEQFRLVYFFINSQTESISIHVDNLTLESISLYESVLITLNPKFKIANIHFNVFLIKNTNLTQCKLLNFQDNTKVNIKIDDLKILNASFKYTDFLRADNVVIQNMLIKNLTFQEGQVLIVKNQLSLTNFQIAYSNFSNWTVLFLAKSIIMDQGFIYMSIFEKNVQFISSFSNECIIRNIQFLQVYFINSIDIFISINATYTEIQNMSLKHFVSGPICQVFSIQSNQLFIQNIYIQSSSFEDYPFIQITQPSNSQNVTYLIENLTIINIHPQTIDTPILHVDSQQVNLVLSNIKIQSNVEQIQYHIFLVTAQTIKIQNCQFIINTTKTNLEFQLNSLSVELKDIYISYNKGNNQIEYLFQLQSSKSLIQDCVFMNTANLVNLIFEMNATNKFIFRDNLIYNFKNNYQVKKDENAQKQNILPLIQIYQIMQVDIFNNVITFKSCYTRLFQIRFYERLSVIANQVQIGFTFITQIALSTSSTVVISNNIFYQSKMTKCCQHCYLITTYSGKIIIDGLIMAYAECSLLYSIEQVDIQIQNVQSSNINHTPDNYLYIESTRNQNIKIQKVTISLSKFNKEIKQICGLLPQTDYISQEYSFISITLQDSGQNIELREIILTQNQISETKTASLIYISASANLFINNLLIQNNDCNKNCLKLHSRTSFSAQLNSILFYHNTGLCIMNLINGISHIDEIIIYGSDADQLIQNNQLHPWSTLKNGQIYSNNLNCQPLNGFAIQQTALYCWKGLNLIQNQLHLSLNYGRIYFRNLKISNNNYTIKIENQYTESHQFYIPTGQIFKNYQRVYIENNSIQYKHYDLDMQFGYSSKYYKFEDINCYMQTILQANQQLKLLNNISFTFQHQYWDDFMIIAPPKNIVNFILNCVTDLQTQQLSFKGKIFDCQIGEILVNQNQCLVCDQIQYQYSVLKKSTQCKFIDQKIMKSAKYGNIELRPGFWRPSFYNDEIVECLTKQQSCLGGLQVNNFSCKPGYIGALCSQCDLFNIRGNGKFSMNFNQECNICDQSILSNIFKIIGLIIMYVICQNQILSIDVDISINLYQILEKYSDTEVDESIL